MLPFIALYALTNISVINDPPDFIWGTSTASYQIEGAVKDGGRLPSIWDTFSHTPRKTWHGQTGDIADDHYHRYVEDVQLMKAMGLSHYRFSIAWPRIVPDGVNINSQGIAFYNKLINTLLAAGIQPLVTLYHWDLPQALNNAPINGWLNSEIEKYFTFYADVCFLNFGDRVKYWLTFNEPKTFCDLGYGSGIHAPGRCSDRSRCVSGNSATEPYLCTHNVLNSHASVYRLYHNKYAPSQKGKISIALNSNWYEPLTKSLVDKEAAERKMEFVLARWADPIYFGDYPDILKSAVGKRLPQFTLAQKQRIKGSHDFYGMNHYTSKYISAAPANSSGGPDTDCGAIEHKHDMEGNLIGPQAASPWLNVVPWGILKNLKWIANRYRNPTIYITENGCDVPGESEMLLHQALNDTFRINYLEQYIKNVMLAVLYGVNVGGYFVWSFMDNFEWADGYRFRFGLHYIDYDHNLTRYQKNSALWYKKRITSGQQCFLICEKHGNKY